MDDSIVPFPLRALWFTIQYSLVWVPAVLGAIVLHKLVRHTTKTGVVVLAFLRALIIAPLPIDERTIRFVPYPVGVIDYIAGDGTHMSITWFLGSLVFGFLVSIAGSRIRTEWKGMQGDN